MASATTQHRAAADQAAGFPASQAPAASVEDSVERVRSTLHRRGSFTEIMRKALLFCAEQRPFSVVEDEIATYPEFKYVDYSQAAILDILVHVGALDELSLDASGAIIPAARLRSLTEDARDDLIASFALKTTEAGLAAIDDMDPATRLNSLFAEVPERNETYLRVMDFCRTPRTFDEVAALLEGDAPAKSRNPYTDLSLYPSAYLGHLEGAGGLVWDEGWILTDDGAAFAASYAGR